ncbi:MAG: hypothetical protein HY815_01215 [Candidatus Riflebacteria bacterium]|nr:hypothetical protein [Candidatus Riflebacteria bacterium]
MTRTRLFTHVLVALVTLGGTLVAQPPNAVRQFSESEGDSLRIILPRADAEPEVRSRMTTTTVSGRMAFEQQPDGWRRIEVLDSIKNCVEGWEYKDPVQTNLMGLKVFAKIDPAGLFKGLENAPGHLAEFQRRLGDRGANLTVEGLEGDVRDGWQRKVSRFLGQSYTMDVPTFFNVEDNLPGVGPLVYFVCVLPTDLVSRGGKTAIRLELMPFAASLKEGLIEGVPELLAEDFARWSEGRSLSMSPEELWVGGEGEVVLELDGMGTVTYRMDETFAMAPAWIKVPDRPPIEATEVEYKRVAEYETH